MGLIATLRETLHLSAETAEALAGGMIGGLRQRLLADDARAAAAALESSLPELPAWEEQTANALGRAKLQSTLDELVSARHGDSPAGLGGLAVAATDLLTRAGITSHELDISFVTGLMSRLRLDPSNAPGAAHALGDFLRNRLPEEALQAITRRAPFLLIGHVSGGLGKRWTRD